MPCGSNRPGALLCALAALTVSFSFACTDPQSGLFAKRWCTVAEPEAASTTVLDDMEDGDGKPCGGEGSWSLSIGEGGGETTPGPGPILKADDLPDGDLSMRTPSWRALHISGKRFAEGGWTTLRLDLPAAQRDLNAYKEIQFWARSDSPGTLMVRAAIVTAVTAASTAHWGSTITVTDKWGDNGNPNSFALIGDGDGLTPESEKDLSQSLALELQFTASASVSDFGLWIDDVVLRRLPSDP